MSSASLPLSASRRLVCHAHELPNCGDVLMGIAAGLHPKASVELLEGTRILYNNIGALLSVSYKPTCTSRRRKSLGVVLEVLRNIVLEM